MKKYVIKFYDDEPVKINEAEFKAIEAQLNKAKFLQIKGSIKAVASIKAIDEIKQEPLGLPAPEVKPIPVTRLAELKAKIAERFSW